MRNVVNNNFGYVTCEFAYSNGTGYVVAYTGRVTERLWMNPLSIKGCKSRDEAELKALMYLINGDPRKNTYAQHGIHTYAGFSKNARIQLYGFSALEKGIYNTHRANTELWKTVLNYFANGKDGNRFDLIKINDTYSKAINRAETYSWTADNREQHAMEFKAMVNAAIKAAKAASAGTAKAEPAAEAKTESALTARVERAISATTKKEVA